MLKTTVGTVGQLRREILHRVRARYKLGRRPARGSYRAHHSVHYDIAHSEGNLSPALSSGH